MFQVYEITINGNEILSNFYPRSSSLCRRNGNLLVYRFLRFQLVHRSLAYVTQWHKMYFFLSRYVLLKAMENNY